jgi:hypothetical protein
VVLDDASHSNDLDAQRALYREAIALARRGGRCALGSGTIE